MTAAPALTASQVKQAAGTAETCPLCRQPFDPLVRSLAGEVEPGVARRLAAALPGWRPRDGICPQCAWLAARQAQQGRSLNSLQEELLCPYPVYDREDTRLLPTPLRVGASLKQAGRGVTLAFLDAGFYPHADLTRPRNRILAYVDAASAEPAERTRFKQRRPASWHGLMVSSIGAGSGHASGGLYPGLAPGASLVLVRTGSRRSQRRISDRDIYRALAWVLANAERFQIRVVNISLGGDIASTGAVNLVDGLVDEAAGRGLLVVAAAGNGGARQLVAPASAFSALTVGAADDQNTLDRRYLRLHNSNYGRGAFGANKPDLVAPGRWLAAPMLPQTQAHNEVSYLWHLLHAPDQALQRHLEGRHAEARFRKETLRLPLDEVRRVIRRRLVEVKAVHANYQHVDGTSMAAPIVSGIAAQMLEANPGLAPAGLKEILCATADPIAGVPRGQQGAGLVNAARALAAARRVAGGPLAGLSIGPSPNVAPEGIHLYYYDPAARQVAVTGSFNGWQSEAGGLRLLQPGLWHIRLPRLPAGRQAYRFLVDGRHWLRDPENPALEADGFGDYHSALDL